MTILDALAKAGVAFVALKGNIRVEGRRDIQTKVMTTLFALFAEVERDLISERTREGLARARSSGRKLGRPKGSLARLPRPRPGRLAADEIHADPQPVELPDDEHVALPQGLADSCRVPAGREARSW